MPVKKLESVTEQACLTRSWSQISEDRFSHDVANIAWSSGIHYMVTVMYTLGNKLSRSMTKPTQWPVSLAKTQISLGIRQIWSEPSLSAWRNIGSHWAHSEDSDQTGRMPSLTRVFAGRTGHIVGFVILRLIYLILCELLIYLNYQFDFPIKTHVSEVIISDHTV